MTYRKMIVVIPGREHDQVIVHVLYYMYVTHTLRATEHEQLRHVINHSRVKYFVCLTAAAHHQNLTRNNKLFPKHSVFVMDSNKTLQNI